MKLSFMRTSMSLAILLSASAAIAQVNVEEINRQNAETINREYHSKKAAERVEAKAKRAANRAERKTERQERAEERRANRKPINLKPVTDHIKKGLTLKLHSAIPKRDRTLTSVEKKQAKLLKCVERMLTENKGGYEAPSIAAKVLSGAFEGEALTKNSENLAAATTDCYDLYNSLYDFPDSTIDQQKMSDARKALPEATLVDKKVKGVISTLDAPKVIAASNSVLSAEAGFVFIARAGLSKVRILMSNGILKRYIGPQLGIGGGLISANVSLTEKDLRYESDYASTGALATTLHYSEAADGDDADLVTGIGSLSVYGHSIEGLALGVGMTFMRTNISGNIRFFDAARRWEIVLDQLN